MKNEKKFGVMLDMSRNAVMKPEEVKNFARILAAFGYNTLMLYTEDTYEVNGEPYFGLMRGRYTKAELKDLDAYCASLGIELIPCIQTLAHLERIFTWAVYRDHVRDWGDVLMVDEERTYTLIDNMFKTVKECFSSKVVHVGMDEAMQLGMGFYKFKHGKCDPDELYFRHLNKVLELAKKNGLEPIMWSDMIFRSATNGNYSGEMDTELSQEVKDAVPQGMGLVYWSYFGEDEGKYRAMMKKHKELSKNVWFAGGLHSWHGFSPANAASLKYMLPAMRACRKEGVDQVLMTMWGDNGKECSFYSLLPSMYAVKRFYDGVEDEKQIKKEFEKITGESYDALMSLDAPNFVGGNDNVHLNVGRAMFYTDPFLGYFDTTVVDGVASEYAKTAKKYREYAKTSGYAYLFRYMEALCSFLSVKYDLGWRTYLAYRSKDKDKLSLVAKDYRLAIKRLDEFYTAFRAVWFKENRPHGFEVQDQRIGGMRFRLWTCYERLQDYIEGNISCVEELEEKRLDYYGKGDKDFGKKAPWSSDWRETVTPNTM